MSRRAFIAPVDVVKREYAKPQSVRAFAGGSMWKAESMLVERYVQSGASVLDIACGAGRTAIPLAQRGFQVTAIDFLPEMLEAAIERSRQEGVSVEFILMDATEMNFPDESFDAVVCLYNSLELIWGRENRVRLLHEVHRLLKPGGVFVLTSRSGFAVGKRWLAWPWLVIRTFVLKPLSLANPHLELQDVYSRGTYHRYQSPFGIRRDLRRAGFTSRLFNGRCNIEEGREASFFTNFSADMCLFFVAQK